MTIKINSNSSIYKCNTLYDIIYKNKHDKKIALYYQNKKISYSMLNKYSKCFAAHLSSENIKSGDRVAILMENSIEYIVSIFAISKINAIAIPINTFLTSREIEYIINDADIKNIIMSNIFERNIDDNIKAKISKIIYKDSILNDKTYDKYDICYIPRGEKALDDEAVIMYTSGTTGKPKGVILTNRNILSNADAGSKHANIKSKDRFIVFLPMFHSFTFTIGLILPLYSFSSVVIIKSVKPFNNIIKEILLKRVTIVLGVPEVYKALSKANLPWYFFIFNKINAFVSGGSPLQSEILETMQKRFKGADMLEAYGLTEAGPTVSLNPRKKQKLNSVGLPFPGYKIKIMQNEKEAAIREIGKVFVAGENIMKGYLNNFEETKKTIVDNFLKTGDLGYLDEEGYLFLVGREKDLIISKGMNIYPKEIEDLLDKHDIVKLSAVVGKLNEKNEEVVTAYIECDINEHINTLEYEKILKKYLEKQLAQYKIPKQFIFCNQLERNIMGKVNKQILKNNNIEDF
ncbi:MAG: AMP-binding protein [Campylobacteraceae bacterium]|jgi:long-chain acyl-CoA synthetase|nr:AMP-binding protein [Campylobacteraceae bacterium]